jgi:hypothetical protein
LKKEKRPVAASCGALNDQKGHFCQPREDRNGTLTKVRDACPSRRQAVAADPLAMVRNQVSLRVAEIRERGARISALDLHARMDAIRQLACDHGMPALESLARCSAQLALLPGHRVALQSCLEHVDDALDSRSARDCTTILAALAARLH